jgi:hypothetical protein
MRKPEQLFWTYLHDNAILRGHVLRIENKIGAGTPDVNLCDHGRETWIELKVGDPKSLVTRLLEPEQIAWHMARVVYGQGSVFVLTLHNDVVYLHRAVANVNKHKRYSLVTSVHRIAGREAVSAVVMGGIWSL